MKGPLATTLFVVLMAAVIVTTDLLFFRDRLRARFIVNVAIVLIFAALYFWTARRR